LSKPDFPIVFDRNRNRNRNHNRVSIRVRRIQHRTKSSQEKPPEKPIGALVREFDQRINAAELDYDYDYEQMPTGDEADVLENSING
jgi:hypothetical protein